MLNSYRFAPAGGLSYVVGTAPAKTTDPAITAPAHSSGDLLLAFVYQEQAPTVADPSGWTRLFYESQSSNEDRGLGAWSRVADGTSTDNPTFDFSFGAASGVIAAIAGGAVADSDVVATAGNLSTVPSNDKAMTSAAGDLAFFCVVIASARTITTEPGDTVELSETNGIVTQTIGLATEDLAGAVGLGNWVLSASTNLWISGTVIVTGA